MEANAIIKGQWWFYVRAGCSTTSDFSLTPQFSVGQNLCDNDVFVIHCHLRSIAVAYLTAVREVLGSNRAVGSCVLLHNHCDLQP